MEIEYTITGVQEFFENLDIYNLKLNRSANEALREGGEVMKANYQAATPVDTGKAQGDVVVGRISTDSASSHKSIKVGYAETYYYMWFVDQGTYDKGMYKGIYPRRHITGNYQGWFSESQHAIVGALAARLG